MNYDEKMTESVPTFVLPLGGKDITFRALNQIQVALVAQLVNRLRRAGDDAVAQMNAAARILDMIQASAVDPADQEFIEDAMAVGKIDLDDFSEWFSQAAKAMAATAGGEVEAKPRVRRTRR